MPESLIAAARNEVGNHDKPGFVTSKLGYFPVWVYGWSLRGTTTWRPWADELWNEL